MGALGDTVWGIATAAGGARCAVRISGPDAFAAAGNALERELPRRRDAQVRTARFRGQPFECLVLTMVGPQSFTGEDVVELHLPGSELLAQRIGERSGARMARPGEFTRRVYENGRLDLASAEAVMDLVHASSNAQRRAALHVLRGGLSDAVEGLRARLLDVASVLESGLDFTAGETGAVDPADWMPALVDAGQELDRLVGTLPAAQAGGDLMLVGAANAGKSSLCNALAGTEQVLVSDLAGTTRDVLRVEVGPGRFLLDAPGDLDGDDGTRAASEDQAALRLRDALAIQAGGAVAVIDPTVANVMPSGVGVPILAVVQTRADRCPDPEAPAGMPVGPPRFVVSCVTGAGLEPLRSWLRARPRRGVGVGGGRVATHLRRAADAFRRAVDTADPPPAPELVAVDLHEALAELEAVSGRSSPDDVLDRIFGRFCLGK